MLIPHEDLDFWIKHNLNVLLIGEYGIGKTAIIKEAFDRNNVKWKYFSGSTLDPWVDFVGIPREVEGKGGVKHLDFVRPSWLNDEDTEAIFIDEYNRTLPKIRNAVMELIQFKSINGKVLNNLKMVWAAINPEEKDEKLDDFVYNIERLDPAQKDRFHIIYEVAYKPDKAYFNKKYPTKSNAAIDWWNDLSPELKKEVSPRRLDYALHVHSLDGDIRHVLPKKVNIAKLLTELAYGSYDDKLAELFNLGDVKKAKEFLFNENNYQICIPKIQGKKDYMNFFLPLISDEKFMSVLGDSSSGEKVIKHVTSNRKEFESKITSIASQQSSSKVLKSIQTAWGIDFVVTKFKLGKELKFDLGKVPEWGTTAPTNIVLSGSDLLANLKDLQVKKEEYNNTYDRQQLFNLIGNLVYTNKDSISVEGMGIVLSLLHFLIERSQFATLKTWNMSGLYLYCFKMIDKLGVNYKDTQLFGNPNKITEYIGENCKEYILPV